MKTPKAFLVIFISAFMLAGCTTAPVVKTTKPRPGTVRKIPETQPGHTVKKTENKSTAADSVDSKLIDRLLENARWVQNCKTLSVNGRRYNMDCSGVICAIYARAGIDLTKEYSRYTGGGVQRIHKYLSSKGLIYQTEKPVPGDLIFWDDTWDANKNRKDDDELTHIGMVVSCDDRTGNIVYVHYNSYYNKITMEKMNLLRPNDSRCNSVMRARGLPKVNGYKYLSGQLCRDIGKGYLLKN